MKRTLALIAATTLGACAAGDHQYTPVVSQYNGDSVSIQIDVGAAYQNKETQLVMAEAMVALARNICRTGHKRDAKYVSTTRTMINSMQGYDTSLFLCL